MKCGDSGLVDATNTSYVHVGWKVWGGGCGEGDAGRFRGLFSEFALCCVLVHNNATYAVARQEGCGKKSR